MTPAQKARKRRKECRKNIRKFMENFEANGNSPLAAYHAASWICSVLYPDLFEEVK